MRLVISLPTRGHAEELVRNVKISCSNLALDNTLLMVQADDDDAPTLAVKDSLEALDKRVVVNVKPREDTIAEKWNRALSEPADVYLVDADDAPFVAPGYDAKILEAAGRFPDGIGMVYGRMANLSFSGVVAPTAKLCEKLGHIFPEHFAFWFVDHWTDDIARIIGRISYAEVRTDQSRCAPTRGMREPGWWGTWFDAAYLIRRRIAHDIIMSSDFNSPEWLKDILLTHHPLIEDRSRMINNGVRQHEATNQMPVLLDRPERYMRVKQRAIAMIPKLLEGMDPTEAEVFSIMLSQPQRVTNIPRAFNSKPDNTVDVIIDKGSFAA